MFTPTGRLRYNCVADFRHKAEERSDVYPKGAATDYKNVFTRNMWRWAVMTMLRVT